MANKKQKKQRKNPAGPGLVDKLRAKKNARTFDTRQALVLASRHHQSGNLSQAEQLYNQVLSADPESITALYSLGVIAHQTRRINRGIQLLNKAIALKPDFVDGHNFLGILHDANDDFSSAAKSYQKVISINPDYFEAYNNLGSAYFKLGKLDFAIINFQKAISLRPDFALAHNNLGNAYKNKGRLEDAIASYREALAIDPQYVEAHCNLGKALRDYGLFQPALESYRKALSVKPDHAEAHRNISKLKKYSPGDEHIAEMETFFADQRNTDEQRMHLAFALAKAYEDCREYERSFEYLLTGNSLKRGTFEYKTEETVRLNKTIKEAIDSVLNCQQGITGMQDKTPTFILGMPRSGTTLVEQTLASHPDVYGAGELSDLKESFLQLADGRQLEESFVALVRKPNKILSLLGKMYIQRIRAYSPDTTFITDKMPHNFQLVGLIRLALPGARIIHCVRDPMDNCFSIFKNYFAGEHNYAYDLKELGQYYLLYQDLMEYWHTVFPGTIYNISYEKLVKDQEGETRKLLQHCELPWNDACLSFHKTSRKVATASATQVRKPIYDDSVQLWKRYEKQLQPLKEILSNHCQEL